MLCRRFRPMSNEQPGGQTVEELLQAAVEGIRA
jgi:hypothetical protein